MPNNAADRLLDFILSKSEDESLARRAALYTDAAEVIASEPVARRLRTLAAEAQAFDRKSQRLQLELRAVLDGIGGGQGNGGAK